MRLQELADVLDVDIVLTRYPNQSGRWTAKFERCETKDKKEPGILSGTYGNGFTPEEAIKDYVDGIKGKTLVFNAASDDRKEFEAPKYLTV